MTTINEADVEKAALAWLSDLGWQVAHGPDIAPDTSAAERDYYGQVMLERRLRDTLADLNPSLPAGALDDAYRKLTRLEGSSLEARNRAFHRMLVNGVEVEYPDAGGRVRGDLVRVIDFDEPANNDWLAVNQFTVTENRNTRRPDVAMFVNGLPLGVIELKNPADEDATIWAAWQQLQTYKAELPSLFAMAAGSPHRSPRLPALVPDHQVPREPEQGQVRRDPQAGGTPTGGNLQIRVAVGRGRQGQELSGSNNHRTVDSSPVRCTSCGSDDHDHSRHRRRSRLDEITTLAWLVDLG